MEFVKYVRPHYPDEARNRHIEGTVILSAVVTRDGTVKGVKPVSGDPSLLKAAETAVRDWVYRPYQINGKPVDVDTEIVINFALPRRLNP
jgi:TonB family protein